MAETFLSGVRFYDTITLSDSKGIVWDTNNILSHNGTQTYLGDATSASTLTLNGGNASFEGEITSGSQVTVDSNWVSDEGSLSIVHDQNTLGGIGIVANSVYKGGLIQRDGTAGNFMELTTYTSQPLKLRTNNTDRVTVAADGKVGLGKAPSTWAFDVDTGLIYIAAFDGANNTGVVINSNNTTAAQIMGYSNSASTYNDLDIRANSTAGSGVYIDGSASTVGVGTTTPQQKLTVNGATFITGALTSPGSAGSYTYNGTAVDYHSDGARYWSWGNATTRGTFNFIQLENDGQNQQTALSIDSSGNATFAGSITVGTGNSSIAGDLYFGVNADIFKSSGTLNINASNLALNNAAATKTYLLGTDGGSVQLRYNDNTKLETTAGGAIITGTLDTSGTIVSTGGNIRVGSDTGKFFAGASNDLQMYHDGNNSKITNITGGLYLGSDTAIGFQSADHSSNYLTLTSSLATFAGQVKSLTGWFTDNVYLSGGQLYIGASGANSTTDDSHRLLSTSGAFKIQSRESGTWTDHFTISTSGVISGNGSGLTGVTSEWDGTLTGNATITSDGSNADGAQLNLKHANNNTTDTIGTIFFGNNADATLSKIVSETNGANNTSNLKFGTSNAGTMGTVLTLNADNSATFENNAIIKGDLTVNHTANTASAPLYIGGNISRGSWNDGIVIDESTGWAATVYKRSNNPKMFTGLYSGNDNYIWMATPYSNSGTSITAPRTDAVLMARPSTDDLQIYLDTHFGGRIGVGTDSPEFALHLADNVNSGGLNSGVMIEMRSSTATDPAGMRFVSQTSGSTHYMQNLYDGANLKWKHWSGSAYVDKITFSNAGNATFAGNITAGSTSLTASNNYVLDVKKAYSSGNGHVAYFGAGTNTAAKTNFDTVVVAQDDVPCLAIIEGNDANTASSQQALRLAVGDNNAVISASNTSGGLLFFVDRATTATGFATNSGTRALHLLNSGNAIFAGTVTVGTGTVAAANAAADDFVIKGPGTTATGMTISNTSDSGTGTIFFGDTTSSSVAGFRYNHNTGDMAISAEDNITFTCDNVGIGTSDPSKRLHVYQTGNNQPLLVQTDDHVGIQVKGGNSHDRYVSFQQTNGTVGSKIGWDHSSQLLKLNAVDSFASTHLAVDVNGNVGIGTADIVDNYAAGITPESTKLAVHGGTSTGFTEVAHFAAGSDSNDTGATIRVGHVGNDRGMFIKAGRGTSDQAKAYIGVRTSANVDQNIITLTQGQLATFAGDVEVTGDFQVNGTTTTVNATNLDLSDNIIGLNRGASSNSNDCGLIIERGSTGNNAAMIWDEANDRFVFGLTTSTPSATGSVSISATSNLAARDLDVNNISGSDGTFTGDVLLNVIKSRSADLDFYTVTTGRDMRFRSGNNDVQLRVKGDDSGILIHDIASLKAASVTSATTTTTVSSVPIATYTAAFFDYSIKNGTNVRAGIVTATHDGTNVEFNETSTVDLGDTSDVTLSVDISSGDMRLRATTTSSTWTIKALIRGI